MNFNQAAAPFCGAIHVLSQRLSWNVWVSSTASRSGTNHTAIVAQPQTEYKLSAGADIPMEYEGNEEVFQKAKEYMDIAFQTKYKPDRLA